MRWPFAVPIAALVALVLLAPGPGLGAEPSVLVSVELMDGSRVDGVVLSQDGDTVVLRTEAGIEMKIPRSTIRSMQRLQDARTRPPS